MAIIFNAKGILQITKLKIDIDTKLKKFDFSKIYEILRLLNIFIHNIKHYKTKHGYHVYIDIVGKFNPTEIILIQALCNSDLKREAFNYIRYKQGNWDNILFKKKWRKSKLVSHETEL